MNVDIFRHARRLGDTEQTVKVFEQRVHAGVGAQSHEVQLGAALLHAPERGLPHGVARDLAIGDGLGDAHDLLIDDAAGADVLVADFAVAHHAGGHADIEPARGEQRERIPGVQPVVARLARQMHGISLVLRRVGIFAPAIANYEENGLARSAHK